MNTIKQHSVARSIALHLIPGALGTLAYILLAPPLIKRGYPSLLGILVAAAAVILPIELAILWAQAKRIDGTFSLREVVLYRERLPTWQYVVIPLAMVVWGFLATGVTPLLDNLVAESLFSWLPEWFFFFDLGQFQGLSRSALMLTFVVGLVVNGLGLPFLEELYFRGYLLPRLERFGAWAPLINLALFSLYHFWSPWQVFSRILWMFPWVYVAWRKRNIWLILITHCAANTLGWLLAWGRILGQ